MVNGHYKFCQGDLTGNTFGMEMLMGVMQISVWVSLTQNLMSHPEEIGCQIKRPRLAGENKHHLKTKVSTVSFFFFF